MSDPLTPEQRAELERAIREALSYPRPEGRAEWPTPETIERMIDQCIERSVRLAYTEDAAGRIPADPARVTAEDEARARAVARRMCAEAVLAVIRDRAQGDP